MAEVDYDKVRERVGKEVRGDSDGFRKLLDAGVPPDHVALGAVSAIRDMMIGLMEGVPKGDVSMTVRIQVMALATTVDNTHAALMSEVIELPKGVSEALDALTDVLRGRSAENAQEGGKGGEKPDNGGGRTKEPQDDGEDE